MVAPAKRAALVIDPRRCANRLLGRLMEMSVQRILRCYAERKQGVWQAFCVDFFGTWQCKGTLFEEVYASLDQAVHEYIGLRAPNSPGARTGRGFSDGARRSARGSRSLSAVVADGAVRRAAENDEASFRVYATVRGVNFRDFITIIERHGFELKRTIGSHRQYEGLVGGQIQLVTVAAHPHERRHRTEDPGLNDPPAGAPERKPSVARRYR